MFIPYHKENWVFLMILPFLLQSKREDNQLPQGERGVKHHMSHPQLPSPSSPPKFHTGPETLPEGIFCPMKLAENPKIHQLA